MSAKQMMYDGLYEDEIEAGDRRKFMEVPGSSAVDGLCHTIKDVSIRHLIVKYDGNITQGSVTLTLAYPAISTPPTLVLDSSSPNVVLWDLPVGLVKTIANPEASSAIRLRVEPTSDLSPQIENLQVQIMLDHDLSEDWMDLVSVYRKTNVTRRRTADLTVYKWGNYVSPDAAKLSSLLVRQLDSSITRGQAEVKISVNSSQVKSVVLDKNTSSIESVDLLADNITISRGDEVSMVVTTDRKFRPSGIIDLEVGLEVQHL